MHIAHLSYISKFGVDSMINKGFRPSRETWLRNLAGTPGHFQFQIT